ncbi:MAG TPA: alpha/beta hydrolase [Bauldia sp.]|nr:alpha/beta hydrolase [Bauldia sp.]
MELYGLDSNPVPDGAVVGAIVTSDGVTLRYARWRATARRSLGTVCLFQGRGETIERYFEVVGDLRRRGFAVAAVDWRGQGGSERRLRDPRKGHVDSFEEYDRDLEAFMEQVALPDCPPPYFALAHSTGGLVCLRAVGQGRSRFTRMLLSAPLLGFGATRPSPAFSTRLAAFLTAIGLGEMRLPRSKAPPLASLPFEGNGLTSDPRRFARNVEIARDLPGIGIGAPTFGWLHAAARAMGEVADPDFGPAVTVPVLIVVGSLDRVISLPAIEEGVGQLRVGSQVVIAGARHDLMMERDSLREQFFAAFDAFIPGT